ncbi:hypothetical protein RHOSPDRAFT_37489 [Rhodotorula sp. JG-1b]|nr:hypothetical protein RHOSPDRAFT_37489 [Rhodotorula sp. JG-1b]
MAQPWSRSQPLNPALGRRVAVKDGGESRTGRCVGPTLAEEEASQGRTKQPVETRSKQHKLPQPNAQEGSAQVDRNGAASTGTSASAGAAKEKAKSKRKKAKKATQPKPDDSNGGGSYAAIAAHHDHIASNAPIVAEGEGDVIHPHPEEA